MRPWILFLKHNPVAYQDFLEWCEEQKEAAVQHLMGSCPPSDGFQIARYQGLYRLYSDMQQQFREDEREQEARKQLGYKE